MDTRIKVMNTREGLPISRIDGNYLTEQDIEEIRSFRAPVPKIRKKTRKNGKKEKQKPYSTIYYGNHNK
jgi:hypothetical protein